MSDRPVNIIIEDILDAINAVADFIAGKNYEIFVNNRMCRDAVLRNIEVIGEAINKLPSDFLGEHPNVEWHKPRGMRNRLAHGYFAVDFLIVWETATTVLPEFKIQIEQLLKGF
jgi:uncharacterized protein with HEPN domain